MAGCEEWANVEEVPSMIGKEGSETAIDKIRTKKMDKAKHAAGKVWGGRMQRFSIRPKGAPVEAGKAAAAMDKIQTEKVLKCAESDGQPAGVKGKQRLPDEYVGLILSMPREKAVVTETEEMEMSFMSEERLKQHKEAEALSEEIYRYFLQFQNRVRDEFLEKGHVEVDEDYLTNIAESEKEDRAMWEETRKKRDPVLTFAARDDPNFACWYAPFDPVKQAKSLLSDVN